MGLEISQLSIQVKSDGVTTAATGLESIAVAGTKAEAGANAAKVALTNLSSATEGLSKSATNSILKGQQQIDTFGKGKEFGMSYAAVIKGLSEANVALMGSLGASIDAQKASAQAQRESVQAANELAKANRALGETEAEAEARSAVRVATFKAEAEARKLAAAEQMMASSPNVWSRGASPSSWSARNSLGSATAMQQTQSLTKDAEDIAKKASATKALTVAEDAHAEALQRIAKTYDPYHSKLQLIDDDIATLKSTFKAGEEPAANLVRQLAALEATKVATTLKATEQAAVGAAGGMAKFSMESSVAKREFITMIREIMRGDFTRLAGSASIFANATGMMGTAAAFALNPITLTVVAVTALGVAAAVGANEATAFNRTLLMTGGYASMSADQFGKLTKELGNIGSEGQHGAAKALTEIAASGKFTGAQLSEVGRAAITMQEATGQAVQQTVKEFEKLRDEPVKASMDLNDKYHYLTASVYEQIRALDEQGDHTGAVNTAIHAMADSIAQRAPEEVANIGTLESAWNAVKRAIVGATNATLNVGRTDPQSKIDALQEKIDNNNKYKGIVMGFGSSQSNADRANKPLQAEIDSLKEMQRLTARVASNEQETTAAREKGVKASQYLQDVIGRTKPEQLKKAMHELDDSMTGLRNDPSTDKTGLLKGVSFDENGQASGGAYDQAKAALEKRFTEHGRKPRTNDYATDAAITDQKGQQDEERRLLAQHLKDMKGEYQLGLIDTKEYITEQYVAKAIELAAEEALQEKIYHLAQNKKNPKAAQVAANELKKIHDKQRDDYEQFGTDLTVLDDKQLSRTEAYTKKLKDAYDLRQAEIDNVLDTAGMGTKQQQEYATSLALQKTYLKEKDTIQKQFDQGEANGGLTKAQRDTEMATAEQDNKARLAQQDKYLKEKATKDADWYLGAHEALANYQAGADNVASQSQTAFTNAFTGMENALVSFTTTGKLSFTGLVTSILTDIARMEAKAATSQMLGLLTNMALNYYASTTSYGGAAMQAQNGANGFNLNSEGTYGAQGSGFGQTKFADGAAFTNGVATSPMNFNMAQMGEAGPEAIMPLSKTSDGSLGVKMSGAGNSGSSGPVNVNTTINVQGGSATSNTTTGDNATQVHKQFADAMSNAAQAEIAKQMRQGGLLWKMKNGQTGGNG